MIRMILAINNECFIGKDNKLMYRLKGDMLNFKTMTQGGIVVMGRKTFQSLKGALPNRTNYVITSDPTSINHPSELILTPEQFKEEFLPHHKVSNDNVWIIGGAQVYETATPFTSEIICTFVDDDEVGDVALKPKLFGGFTHLATLKSVDVDEDNDKPYEITQLVRHEDLEHKLRELQAQQHEMEKEQTQNNLSTPLENGGLRQGEAFVIAATTSAALSQIDTESREDSSDSDSSSSDSSSPSSD
ncbi:DfrA [Shewanella phage FishSpeaker]|nr:DfrA [Shewanella phage FishSpeaker]